MCWGGEGAGDSSGGKCKALFQVPITTASSSQKSPSAELGTVLSTYSAGISASNPLNNHVGGHECFHLTDEETEAQSSYGAGLSAPQL